MQILYRYSAGYLLAGALYIWTVYGGGYVAMGLGSIALFFTVFSTWKQWRFEQERKAWKRAHEGRLIFFYPTSKMVQRHIEKDILPLLPSHCLKVYYNGTALEGDIKPSILEDLIQQYPQLQPNAPCIFKLDGDTIYSENLYELLYMNHPDFDTEVILERVRAVEQFR